LGYAPDSLGYKILDISTNSIVTSRDVYFMEDMPGTINTTFFCDKYIDSIINFKDSLIEGESINDNNNIHSQLNNPLNNNNNNNNNNYNYNNKYNNNNYDNNKDIYNNDNINTCDNY